MTEVRFGVRFMDWYKGDKAKLKKEVADRYIGLGVCSAIKPKAKRTAAPSNKAVQGAANK